ncbi:MAG TPA: acyl-CoA dehydrogenase family protein [Ktedonobacteraceae bacterium]|nr:acyl-CoA dehydrogenase family protein [Ktedonobacteraceae bacterium]
MLDFSPTEEQEEIRRLAHSIAVEQLRLQGRSSENNGDISLALMQTLTQTGLTTPFPEAFGGSGPIDAFTYALIAEELGFGDAGLAMNILGSMMGPLAVALAGNPGQQEQYIVPFCDEQSAMQVRGSLAFAERTGGYSIGEISATARREGQDYLINGTKRDVIHGERSYPRVVLVRLEGTTGTDGLCAAVLPEQAHIQIERDEQKLGLLAAPSVSYAFNETAIPASALLGEPGNSGVLRAALLYSLLRAGVACGTARAALEYAGKYAEERIAFGRPIVSYQGIAFMVAEMAMKLDAARLLLWNAAVNWDRAAEPELLVRDVEAAQHQALKIAQSATIDAVQIMGGAGFMQDHPVEMWMRNAAAME